MPYQIFELEDVAPPNLGCVIIPVSVSVCVCVYMDVSDLASIMISGPVSTLHSLYTEKGKHMYNAFIDIWLIKISSHCRRTAWRESLLFSLCLHIAQCLTFDYMCLVSFVPIRAFWVTRQHCHQLHKRYTVSGELQPLVWKCYWILLAWKQHENLCFELGERTW